MRRKPIEVRLRASLWEGLNGVFNSLLWLFIMAVLSYIVFNYLALATEGPIPIIIELVLGVITLGGMWNQGILKMIHAWGYSAVLVDDEGITVIRGFGNWRYKAWSLKIEDKVAVLQIVIKAKREFPLPFPIPRGSLFIGYHWTGSIWLSWSELISDFDIELLRENMEKLGEALEAKGYEVEYFEGPHLIKRLRDIR